MQLPRRLGQEYWMLKNAYGQVEIGYSTNSTGRGYYWLLITRFPFPAGWSRSHSAVLVHVEPDYPHTPPDVYVKWQLIEENIWFRHLLENHGPLEVLDSNWVWVCRHKWEEHWRPHSTDPARGDNLVTFLQSMYRGLEKRMGASSAMLTSRRYR